MVGTQAVPVASCEASSRRSASGHAATGGQVGVPRDPGGVQVGERHPPGMADGRVAAGQRHRRQVRGAGEAVAVRAQQQDLAAPDRPIRSVAGAVERHPDDRLPKPPVLREQRDDVRVVVLHEVHRPVPGVALGPLARQVGGVQVGGQPDGHRRAGW